MNYKLQVHFLNDVITWRAHVPALITMDIIKSPFLHQCRLHSNVYGFKIVQKSFLQSSSNLQEANHLGFSCQQKILLLIKGFTCPMSLHNLEISIEILVIQTNSICVFSLITHAKNTTFSLKLTSYKIDWLN